MRQSPKQIKKCLKQLRSYIDKAPEDVVTKRIAYAYEQAIRWALEDTVGWGSPLQQAKDDARILKDELARRL